MSLRAALSFREYPLRQQSEESSFARYSVQQHMLADDTRVHSFMGAIQQSVQANDVVVDIGAGTGLLSYCALKAGAAHVHVIEASAMADVCSAHLRAAGFDGKFTMHRAMSFDVELPTKADVIISETLGHVGIDEGILRTLADAKARFAHEKTRLLPSSMELMVAPVHTPLFERDMRGFWRKGIEGFALEAGAEALSRMSYLTATPTHEYLAEMQVFSTFEFGVERLPPFKGEVRFAANALRTPSPLHGFVLSFRCDLGDVPPLNARDCASWGPIFFPLLEPIRLNRGAGIGLNISLMGKQNVWSGTVRQENGDQQIFSNGY